MSSLQLHNKALYAIVLAMAAFLFFTGLGPGLTPDVYGMTPTWHYDIFHMLCHQDPDRSFSLNGYQMAVCSRCLGIYSMLLLSMLLMPLYAFFQKTTQKTEFIWLIAAIVLNFIDVAGNFLGIWNNTLNSRLVMGGLFGLMLPLVLTNDFFSLIKRSDYGK